jgi:hypothetical protein
MTKIAVGSSSLTQSLLLYPSFEPTMLDNIGKVSKSELVVAKKIFRQTEFISQGKTNL